MRILLIEDDEPLASDLQRASRLRSYNSRAAVTQR